MGESKADQQQEAIDMLDERRRQEMTRREHEEVDPEFK